MPLHGLPVVAQGALVVSSVLSVVGSASGLALLRGTRPSELARFDSPRDGRGTRQLLLGNVLGVFGALLLYIGLVLGSMPMLMGVSTDDEGKAAALVQQTLVLACWLVERYLICGRPLPVLQSCCCALVWLGTTIIEWAGPRPYDNMSLGMPGQIAGCDGGFRSPFVIYASVWLTLLTFGSLLLVCGEEGTCVMSAETSDDDEDDLNRVTSSVADLHRVPHAFRRKALPVVFGMATSMSGILLATGSASNDMGYVVAGALLLMMAVLCAWDWLWRLEMNLATWGAVFQGFATTLRVIQGHFVFRDFRWDPPDVHGILVVYQFPGLQMFMFGMFVMYITLQFYLYTSTWRQWGDEFITGEAPIADLGLSSLSREVSVDVMEEEKLYRASSNRLCRGSSWWQWFLLPVCMVCILVGTHVPLIRTEFVLPDVTWLHDEAAIQKFEASHEPGQGHRFRDGDSYIDVITWLYDRRLPCSALVVSYNAMILPPLQILFFFLILLRPSFVPEELHQAMQGYVMNLAPMRFTQPSIMMLIVGIANMPGPGDSLFGGWFTSGYWFFLTYCISVMILAWSVQPKEDDCDRLVQSDQGRGTGLAVDSDLDLTESEVDTAEESEIRDSLQSTGLLIAAVCVATAVYLALTRPFLNFEYRLSGVVVHGMTPTILDLWFSIGSVSRFLMCFSAATCVFAPCAWIFFFALRMMPRYRERWLGHVARRAEPVVRPWVMCHIWAASFCLVYYIVTARNKAVVEVCAHVPKAPVGLVAVVCMGIGTYALIAFAKDKTRPAHLPKKSSVPNLPGGVCVWGLGPVAMVMFWGALLCSHGPTRPPTISSVVDLNSAVSRILPAVNRKLYAKIPESSGDCEAYWQYRARQGEVLISSPQSEMTRGCSGQSPLTHFTTMTGRSVTNVTALWAKGLNTLELANVKVLAPAANLSTAEQQWYLTISGLFTDVHIYLQVLVDGEEFLKGYMCCDNKLHFTLQVSAVCVPGVGFGSMHLQMLHMDKIDFVQRTEMVTSPSSSASFEMDYGTSAVVEQTIENFMTLKTGKLLMRHSDGSTSDTLGTASTVLSQIIDLNAGHHCPQHI
eukprot:TRINITY_DN27913_c0_g1_i1.p1 TRINITY_DN27913_c0_g1~~TRINITY_DN27913_c0_g1_i1.p1  ORF type:complete len:1079 (-),score=172.59 TRINITY_DN27913_c0_g1_i1:18-3254(-)